MNALDDLVKGKIGYKPDSSVLYGYSSDEWRDFLVQQDLNPLVKGVYAPKQAEAHVLLEQATPEMTKIHEYYGHGTFCEHSMIGHEIVEAVKGGNQEVIDEVHKKTVMYNEGFAMWMEDFVTHEVNDRKLKMQFAVDINSYPQDMLQAYAFAKDIERFGDFYFQREFGFPAEPSPRKCEEFLHKLYPNVDIQMAILYGSRKPTSDVDLFIVSDDITTEKNHWLDVYSVTRKEFNEGIDNLLINITDPIFSGEPIIGEKQQLQAQDRVRDVPITDAAISMNRKAAYEENEILKSYPMQEREIKTSMGYIDAFMHNATALAMGYKLLTKQNAEG